MASSPRLAERRSLQGNKAFLRSWGIPDNNADTRDQAIRDYRYQRLYQLYDGTAFADMLQWRDYKSAFGLYRQIRQVWDHVHELVEFYATHIWSGALAEDGLNLPDGVPNAVPLAEDTDPALAAAIGVLFSWWNFQEHMSMIPRYTSALGELLVEIIDHVEKGHVHINTIWPGHVKDLHVDHAGNLTYYCIEYAYWDATDNKTHTYRREVDADFFYTFRDDLPYDYAENPVPVGTEVLHDPIGGRMTDVGLSAYDQTGYAIPNPYGFVPAVWFRHHRLLGIRGEPAVWSTQAQLDEINSLFAHIIDKTHVNLESPIIVSGNITPNRLQSALSGMMGAVRRTFTDELDQERDDAQSMNVLEAPAGTTVSTIDLKVSEAAEALDRIIKGIERKCPEVVFYSELRSMTQITGPASQNVLGDVHRKVRMLAAGYDAELKSLLAMSIAICAFRHKEGLEGWENPSADQQKFANFSIDDYKNGAIKIDIMPRDLVPPTLKDRYELLQMKKAALPFLPPEQLAKEAGYHKDDYTTWIADWEAKQEEQMAIQQEQMPIKRPVGAPMGGPGGAPGRTVNGRRQETQPRERSR